MKQGRVVAAVVAATACVWIASLLLYFSPDFTTTPPELQTCRVSSWGWTEEEAKEMFPFKPLEPCRKSRTLIHVANQLATVTCAAEEFASYLLSPKDDRRFDPAISWRMYTAPVDVSDAIYMYAFCRDAKGSVEYDVYVHATAKEVELQVQKAIVKEVDARFGGHSSPMKVFVLSLDSVGRNSFSRNFKQTSQLLSTPRKDIWTQDFQQLNVMGFQTRENVVPLLTGLQNSDFQQLKEDFEDWEDQCLWQIFKAMGFRTVLGLENHVCDFCEFFGADFHPSKFFYEFYHLATDIENFQAYNSEAHCIGGRNSHTYLLEYLLSYAELFSEVPVFQYAHIHPGHEPTQQVARLADQDVHDFILSIDSRFAADPYLLVLMADHGHAYQSLAYYANDDKWATEYKIPTLYFRYNRAFRDIVGDSALAANRERLVTPVDLYATLAHVAMKNVAPEGDRDVLELADALAAYNTRTEAFVDLFNREVPAARSCRDVGVKAMWCGCLQFLDAIVQPHILDFLLTDMNLRLKAAPYCRQVSIAKLQYFKALRDHNVTYFSVEFVPDGDSEASFYGIVAESEGALEVEMVQRLTPYEKFCQQMVHLDAFNDSPDITFCVCEEMNEKTLNTTYARLLPFRHLLEVIVAEHEENCVQACATLGRGCVEGLFALLNDCEYLSDRLDDDHMTPRQYSCVQSSTPAAPFLWAEKLVLNAHWSFNCTAKAPEGRRVCVCPLR